MAKQADRPDTNPQKRPKRRFVRNGLLLLVLLVVGALAFAWSKRVELAQDAIGEGLAEYNLEASYQVESIEPDLQVLTNVVIGDPQRPDLTIERVELSLSARFGMPALTQLRLIEPRVFGSLHAGELSFGVLDPLIFSEESGPFEFPDMDLQIEDGRGLIESEFGQIGLKMDGGGHLRGGFAAELAASAPNLEIAGCAAEQASLYGTVSIDAERPKFSGPARFAKLDCAEQAFSMSDGAAQIDLLAFRNLTDFDGEIALQIGRSSLAAGQVAGIEGNGQFTWRSDDIVASYAVELRDVISDGVKIASLGLEGQLRAKDQFARSEIEGELSGRGVQMGEALFAGLEEARNAATGTLIEPLLAQFGTGLSRELAGGSLTAQFTARNEAGESALVIPEAALIGRSGSRILALSRSNFAFTGDGIPLFSGNFVSGGQGIPRLSGRMEQDARGELELHMRMQEFSAGTANLAIPDLHVKQGQGGTLRFTGSALASGALPNGFVEQLVLPIDGQYGASEGLALWAGCRDVRFQSLRLSSLALERESISLCPPSGRPILQYNNQGLQFAAGLNQLDLNGRLGGSSFSIESGPIGLSWPGAMAASDVHIKMGRNENAVAFDLAELSANLSDGDISGEFSRSAFDIAAVPLDLQNVSGAWRYDDGRLDISDLALTLSDIMPQPTPDNPEPEPRFNSLNVRGAVVSFVDGIITANGILREPSSDIAISRVRIAHDLDEGAGYADLIVDGITFGDYLKPLDLTVLVRGVAANVEGTVTGQGRINWNDSGVTSTGAFSTQSLDLAAAFGPVKAARGTINFTDLLGLTTAPNQIIYLGAVNPGIEIYDGEVRYEMRDGEVLTLKEGNWPFLGGTITMESVELKIGADEPVRYVITIRGLDAARFLQRLELDDLSASGVFDGVIPIVFDENGNGMLEGGTLSVRAPGGNLAYVGQLTYEDLSYAGNFAFNALRDLHFGKAEILMDGPLAGELVTQVRFDEVRQGDTADRNFITRSLAKLPIRLDLNIKAPFYQLMADAQRLYDPQLSDLGIDDPNLVSEGAVSSFEMVDELPASEAATEPTLQSEKPIIQPPESETMP